MSTIEIILAMLGSSGFTGAAGAYAATRAANAKAETARRAIDARAQSDRQRQLDEASADALNTHSDLLKEAADRLAAESQRADANRMKFLEEQARADREQARAEKAERELREMSAKHDENVERIRDLEAKVERFDNVIESALEKLAALESENVSLRSELQRYARGQS